MKDMTDDEMKEMWKKMTEMARKAMDDYFVDALINGNTFTTATPPSHNPYLSPSHYAGISPTDVDARGVYGYQESEKDEQGTYYGYKVLHKCTMSSCKEHGGLISPMYQVHWSENGELQADKVPAEDSMFGIHFTKRPDHPELRQYYGRFHGAAYSSSWYEGSQAQSVLVKCALSGTIVETEQGFRAEHAQIVGVLINGNWQSYQDYQERTRAYTHPNPIEEEWQTDWYWKGNWDTGKIPPIDTSGDS